MFTSGGTRAATATDCYDASDELCRLLSALDPNNAMERIYVESGSTSLYSMIGKLKPYNGNLDSTVIIV